MSRAIKLHVPRVLLVLGLLPLGMASGAEAKLAVVATTLDLGALAAAIGGEAVKVVSLAKPTEDPHFVDARPSHVVTLNRSDALIEGGAELEMGWLPTLVEGARNPRIQTGAPGRIVASMGIELIDVPSVLDRAQGAIHAAGNPHFLMDPVNAKIFARQLAGRFCQIDSASCPAFRSNLAAFEARLDQKLQEWSQLLAPFRGRPVVTYHATWRYFARRFDLRSELFLEPKPGIPPSPPHLSRVIERMKSEGIRIILLEPYQNRRVAETVADHTAARIVDVAQFPGALPGTDADYLALMDANVRAIAGALAD